jgi:L-asparaginase II
MMSNPDMVDGPGGFDTVLMTVANGRLVSKGGAEGYQAVALLPGAIRPGSPALGIALKIADGGARAKARHAVMLEVLHQLGVFSAAELEMLANFGPSYPVHNWRKLLVGEAHPIFQLHPAG